MALNISAITSNTNLQSNTLYLVTAPAQDLTQLTLPSSAVDGDFIIVVDRDGTFKTKNCIIKVATGSSQKVISSGETSLLLNTNYATVQLVYYNGLWSLYGTESFLDNAGNEYELIEVTGPTVPATKDLLPNKRYILYDVENVRLPALSAVPYGSRVEVAVRDGGGTANIFNFDDELLLQINNFSNMVEFIYLESKQDWQIINKSAAISIANRPAIFSAMMAMNTL